MRDLNQIEQITVAGGNQLGYSFYGSMMAIGGFFGLYLAYLEIPMDLTNVGGILTMGIGFGACMGLLVGVTIHALYNSYNS